jgi:hypothetical protein
MEFKDLKEELLRRAKEAGACKGGYLQGLNAESKGDLLDAVAGNFIWVLKHGVVDAGFLEENFTPEELAEHGIYTKGQARVKGLAFVCGSATVEACDSAIVEAYGSATVKACDSATVKAFGSATVEACDSATVEAYGSATVEAYGFAIVEAYDSATVEAYDNSYVENCTQKEILPQSGYAIVKDYWAHKVYLKKGEFEIIEVE